MFGIFQALARHFVGLRKGFMPMIRLKNQTEEEYKKKLKESNYRFWFAEACIVGIVTD